MSKKLFIASQAPFVELPVTSVEDANGKKATIKIGFKQYDAIEANKILESFSSLKEEEIESELKKQILYLKEVELAIYDEDTLELESTKKIADTRKVESFEPFWADKNECLVVLLDSYFASFPWKGSIIEAFVQSLLNSPKKGEQVKN